jgi:hypothetical protein
MAHHLGADLDQLARVEDNSLVRALDRDTYALATSAEARPEVGSIPNFHHRLLHSTER